MQGVQVNMSDVLRAVELGSDVAENEPALEEYFVETNDFRLILEDEADLILGVKGSGKSAISRILASENFDIPSLKDVDIIPAFNTGRSAFFARVPSDADEKTFRQLWVAFVISLVGNRLLDEHEEDFDAEPLRKQLKECDLLSTGVGGMSIWKRLTKSIRSFSPEASFEVSETGMPVITTRAKQSFDDGELEKEQAPAWLDEDFDPDELILKLVETLDVIGIRVWVVLDRLDEAFIDRQDIEKDALRGLLRAHLDLGSFGRNIRLKVFLRSDIFDRVTRNAGFLNLDHLRVLRLHWTRQTIESLIVERVASSSALANFIPEIRSTRHTKWIPAILNRTIPPKISYSAGRATEAMPGITWCLTKTTDGLKDYSPRNVLTLLREAQRYALSRPDNRTRRYDSSRSLLDAADLDMGWRRVSSARLEDTLFAEFNELRGACEIFRNGTQRMRRSFLTRALQEFNTDVSQVIRNLKYAGFIVELSHDLYEVADIYVPALNIKPGTSGAKNIGNPPKSSSRPLAPGESIADQARIFLAASDYESAVAVALSDRRATVESLVVASDAALRADQSHLLRSAVQVFETVSQPTSQLVARGVALYLALDQLHSALNLISQQRNRRAELVCHHFIRAFGNHVPLERAAWKSLLENIGTLPPAWAYLVPVTAGSRLLAVSRGLARETNLHAVSREVFNVWWPIPANRWTDHTKKITHSLTNYVNDANKGKRPTLHPYQIVSLWATLTHFGESPKELKSSLMIASAMRLHNTDKHHRENFREWAELDDFAATIARHAGIL